MMACFTDKQQYSNERQTILFNRHCRLRLQQLLLCRFWYVLHNIMQEKKICRNIIYIATYFLFLYYLYMTAITAVK